MLKLDDQTLVHRVDQLTLTLSLLAPVETVEYAPRTAAESVCGLDVNQILSQPTKCISLTTHKAPELTTLHAASYVGVR